MSDSIKKKRREYMRRYHAKYPDRLKVIQRESNRKYNEKQKALLGVEKFNENRRRWMRNHYARRKKEIAEFREYKKTMLRKKTDD